jgi:hypothetical protein
MPDDEVSSSYWVDLLAGQYSSACGCRSTMSVRKPIPKRTLPSCVLERLRCAPDLH